MIRLPPLHRDDALLLSRCFYLGLIVLLFPLKSAYPIAGLSADHFHPPLGPFTLLETFPDPWVIIVIESVTYALLALWVAGVGRWRVGALLSCFLMLTSGLNYSTGKIDHDLVIVLCPFLLTLGGKWPEKSLTFCLAVYFASSGFAKISWLSFDSQASLSWALTYFYGYGKSAPLLAWSLENLSGWPWEAFDQLTVWFELCVPLVILHPFRRYIFLSIPLFHLSTVLLLGIDFSRLLLIYLPLALLFMGVFGYSKLSVEIPEEAQPRRERKPVETRVLELKREDYQVEIPSQGNIRAHGLVNLTAEVAGKVQAIHPPFEEGAFFSKGDILLEINPIDLQVALISAQAQVASAQLNLEKEEALAEQARLDAFAAKSAGQKGGALYEKQQSDLALELKILREADIKDKADAERDRRDKEEVRTKAKQMQEWNLKSAALKKQRERKEVTDEHHYAEDFIRQSEDFMRAEKEKFDRIRKMRERHNVELLEHVRLHKLAQKHVEMDEKEEKVNRGLLKDIYADDKYRKRLAERLKYGQKFTMKKSEEFKYKSNVL